MSPGSGYLKDPFVPPLTPDLGKVPPGWGPGRVKRSGKDRGRGQGAGFVPDHQGVDRLLEAGGGGEPARSEDGRLPGVPRGNDKFPNPRPESRVGGGQHPPDGPDPAGEFQFPQGHQVFRDRDKPRRGHHRKGKGKIQGSPIFPYPRGGKVDQDPVLGKGKSRITEGRPYPFPGFPNRPLRKPRDIDSRYTPAYIYLHPDDDPIGAVGRIGHYMHLYTSYIIGIVLDYASIKNKKMMAYYRKKIFSSIFFPGRRYMSKSESKLIIEKILLFSAATTKLASAKSMGMSWYFFVKPTIRGISS
jgi:hypothetical protein